MEDTSSSTSPEKEAKDGEDKESVKEKVLEMLDKATRGRFRAQFSEARLGDAIAMCERRWDHFATCIGQHAAEQQWPLRELAVETQRRNLRVRAPSDPCDPRGPSQCASGRGGCRARASKTLASLPFWL